MKISRPQWFLPAVATAMLLVGASTPALAQPTTTGTSPATGSAPPSSSVADAGASSSGAGIGVGAAAFLSGIAGLDVVYDLPLFHVEGLFGFRSVKPGGGANAATVTTTQFGARGWYHIHRGISSDFSLGGGLGVNTQSGGGASATATLIEPGMQARVFLTPNFSLHAVGGLSFVFGDNLGGSVRGIVLAPQVTADFGFTYFFR